MLDAGGINWELLVPVTVFGAVAAAAWWLIDFFSQSEVRTYERLEEFKNPSRRRRTEEKAPSSSSEALTKMLEKASPTLAKPLQPKSEEEVGKLKSRLSAAGFRGEGATTIFLGLKLAGLLGGFVLGGGSLLTLKGMNRDAIMYTFGVAGLCFYLPDLITFLIAKSRKEQIFLGLPDVLDLLVVCVESGLGLDQAMRKVSDEMKTAQAVLSDEFALCNFQLQVGKTRSDVLHDLGQRTGVDDLRALAAILIQADKFGSSVAQALRVQSDSMRTRRRQLAEERAAKTAVKLIFPLVLFIFPGIFVVLVGPAAITMVRQMFPAMQGGGG